MTALYSWINPSYVAALFCVIARISGVFISAPLFSNRAVPARVKIAFVIVLSLILLPIVPQHQLHLDFKSDLAIISILLVEVTIGLVLGFVAYLVFAAVQTAGELIGMQLGLGIATIFDPANEGSAGIVTSLYVILGALMFLALDGHHLIVAGLVRSFEAAPLGNGLNLVSSEHLSAILSKSFASALQITIPLLVVSTVMNIVFGFITKLSPTMNIYFNTGFIIGPALGLVILMLSLPLFRVIFTQLTEGMEPEMIRTIRTMKGM